MAEDLERQQAEQDVIQTRKNMLEATGRLKAATGRLPQAPQPMKKWTVTMDDGTIYRGVLAPTKEEASQKMLKGPQGPLASPPAYATPSAGKEMVPPARGESVLPDVARGVGALAGGPAATAAVLGSEIVSPPPSTSGRDVAGSLVPAAVGTFLRPARTVGSFLRTLGGNVLGRGAAEGAAAAAEGAEEGPLAAAAKGAAKGILPGLAQGTVGAVMGPSADTLRVQRAAKALKTSVSPEVAAHIDPSKPATLLSKGTVKSMQDTMGTRLDKMEADVEKALGPQFRVNIGQVQSPQGDLMRQRLGLRAGEPLPPWAQGAQIQGQGPLSAQGGKTFSEVRAQIKELRDIGEKNRMNPLMSETVRASINDARKLENSLVSQMPPQIAARYKAAITQHARDAQAVRELRATQIENELSGGTNPIDRPDLAKFQRAMEPGTHKLKSGLHGALGAAEAAMGRPIGAGYNLGRAMDMARRSPGPLNPAMRAPNIVPRISGAGAGIGVSGLQELLARQIGSTE